MQDKFHYLLKNFNLFYQTDNSQISYTTTAAPSLVNIQPLVPKDFFNEQADIDPNKVIWKTWKGVNIPFLFAANDLQEIMTIVDDRVVINYDIVGAVFYFLSGWNELQNPQRDQFGRVAFKDSMIKHLSIATIPVVNYYFDILHDAIQRASGNSRKRKVWQGRDFGMALSHDIDVCRTGWMEGAMSELKKGKLGSIPKIIWQRLTDKDIWFNFREISTLVRHYGGTSSFYFLCQKGKAGQMKNADYDVEDKKIQREIDYLKKEGHEVGVHGSFGTHQDVKALRRDMSKLGSRPVIGNRFHFLMFDPKETVANLAENGIKYDTTLGFADRISFRRGTCYPFYLYDFLNDRCSEVLELPLLVMDQTLKNSKYMGIDQEAAYQQIVGIIDEVRKFNGLFSLLWHNNFFSEYKYTGWKAVCEKTLAYCQQNNGFISSGKEIYESIIN
ncbi:MAG: polysaccharide deacetylase family protein [Bacteroidota bacterium]